MGWIDARRGSFVPEGDYEEEAERQPDVFEQADRILRGEPPRPSNDIFTQADRILKGLPPREPTDVLSQAERKIRERRVGWAPCYMAPLANDKVRVAHARLPEADVQVAGDKHLPGFINDRGECVRPEDPDYEGKLMQWLQQLLADGVITPQQVSELDSGSYRQGLPTRAELARRRLDDMLREGILTERLHTGLVRQCADPGFKIHPNPLYYQKILRYCYLLEEIIVFMDRWTGGEIPVEPQSFVEAYLERMGKTEAAAQMTQEEWTEYRQLVESRSFGLGRKVTEDELQEIYDREGRYMRQTGGFKYPPGSMRQSSSTEAGGERSNLERGKRIVSSAWFVFRDAVQEAIREARTQDMVVFDDIGSPNWLYLRFQGANARKLFFRAGYKVDTSHVANDMIYGVLDTMVHEPLHRYGSLWLGHSAQGNWEAVDRGIGWNAGGNWQGGLSGLILDSYVLMSHTPLQKGSQATCWSRALERSGIQDE